MIDSTAGADENLLHGFSAPILACCDGRVGDRKTETPAFVTFIIMSDRSVPVLFLRGCPFPFPDNQKRVQANASEFGKNVLSTNCVHNILHLVELCVSAGKLVSQKGCEYKKISL